MKSLACAVILTALLGGGASAQEYSADSSCCGVLYYTIGRGDRFSGDYPKQNGRVFGTINANGTATGTWTQPRSDHPCLKPKSGTYAWGRFVFRDVGSRAINGAWGYCDEYPNRDWGFK